VSNAVQPSRRNHDIHFGASFVEAPRLSTVLIASIATAVCSAVAMAFVALLGI
jgi:hypothetical protein